jgi:hypothetical protein
VQWKSAGLAVRDMASGPDASVFWLSPLGYWDLCGEGTLDDFEVQST